MSSSLPASQPGSSDSPEPWVGNAAMETYLGWLSLPKSQRSPKTEQALARVIGVDRSTLYRWRAQPGFMRAVRARVRESIGEKYADVLRKIEEQALDGQIAQQRLYLELMGDTPAEGESGNDVGVKVLVGVDLALVGNATVAVKRVEGSSGE